MYVYLSSLKSIKSKQIKLKNVQYEVYKMNWNVSLLKWTFVNLETECKTSISHKIKVP